jgi:hypothetical protein
MRRRWLAGTIVGLGLVVSGCTQDPGAAVVVGSLHYGADDLDARTSAVLQQLTSAGQQVSNPVDARAGVNRIQLTDVVRSRFVQQAADQAGVTVTDADVDAALQTVGGEAQLATGLLLPEQDARNAMRDLLLTQKLAAKAGGDTVQADVVTVTYEAIQVSDRDSAIAIRDRVRTATDVSVALAAAGSVQQGSATSADPQQLPAAQAGLFAAQQGDVFVVPQGSSVLVVHVLKRETATTGVQLSTLTSSVQGLQVLEPLMVQSVLAGNPVTVNPRYGMWDARTMNVVQDPATA